VSFQLKLYRGVHRSLDSSHSITSPQSSSHSSQDSLHRSAQQMQPSHSGMMGMVGPRGKKKTGIRSSLGRIFSKKEKARKDLYMASGGRGELTSESELHYAAQDSTLDVVSLLSGQKFSTFV